MYKTKLVHFCYVVPNMVVDIDLFIGTSRFANFAKGKWLNFDSKNMF